MKPHTAATLETPFLEVPHAAWTTASAALSAGEAPFVAESPFVSEYVAGEQTIRPEEPALRELLEELYDGEFDEAVADLAAEAETYVAELGLGESETDQARAEQMLEAWVEPLRQETQALLVGLAEAFESEDPLSMTEDRFDAIFERFEPTNTEYGPAFEGFLKSLVKKAKSIAHGAINTAKSGIAAFSRIMPIGIILRKLAVLARPLLTRVLRFALNRLPVSSQPMSARFNSTSPRSGPGGISASRGSSSARARGKSPAVACRSPASIVRRQRRSWSSGGVRWAASSASSAAEAGAPRSTAC